jgi:hypothetical protein
MGIFQRYIKTDKTGNPIHGKDGKPQRQGPWFMQYPYARNPETGKIRYRTEKASFSKKKAEKMWHAKVDSFQEKDKFGAAIDIEMTFSQLIDWGHFGSLVYGDTKRKLYALAVLEAYSGMLYVEFTHSQNQAALHQCLLNAFIFFEGSPKEILVDNMLTAVTERQGAVVRFNDAFLNFLRTFNIVPVPCNPAAPNEKGKVESAIKYLRQNFWPLRSFADLADCQLQVQK